MDRITLYPLTNRETQVLQFVSKGMLNKEIAAEMKISDQTVKNHVSAILWKLNSSGRTEAVVSAVKQGFITL